jgi:2-(1,2-epoxy-1,2-dihydrophenyl)acetyl-CoA isomerase
MSEPDDAPTVLVEDDEAVRFLTLNRPSRMNALNARMADEFLAAAEAARDDASVRCVVLRGAGSGFFAGGDVADFAAHGDDVGSFAGDLIDRYHPTIEALRAMEKPVVAALHGRVAGAGVSLAMAADLAIAEAGTLFSLAYTGIGASPDGGSTYFLPRIVGQRRALEIALLSERFDADQALSWGLVNRVVAPEKFEQEVMLFAKRLAAGPTKAYARVKRLIEQSVMNDLPAQLAAERAAFMEGAETRDFREGVKAFTEKRKPDFTGE